MCTTSPVPPLCEAEAQIYGAPPKRHTALFQFGYTTYSGGSIKETQEIKEIKPGIQFLKVEYPCAPYSGELGMGKSIYVTRKLRGNINIVCRSNIIVYGES